MDPTQDIQNIQGMYGQMAGMGHPAPSMQAPANFPQERPANMGHPDHGHKKLLLQKLMSNLLSKPGRSMHEMINGVKDAIGAYKNYAKEWDNLSGMAQLGAGAAAGMAAPVAGAAMGASGIRKILQGIQEKKGATPDGGGGPGVPPMGNPHGMPSQAHGTPALGNPMGRAQGVPPIASPQPPVPPSPQPMPPQAHVPSSMPPAPAMTPPQNATPPMNGLPPVAGIPPIAGQPQQSSFNRPAPVNSLGIWGH